MNNFNIDYKLTLLAVKDINASKKFYTEIFNQNVILDMGNNVILSGGIALQQDYARLANIPEDSIIYKSNNMELFFEVDNFDAFKKKLENGNIELVHKTIKHPWQQRVIRVYDPDFHIIEIGESMASIAKRFVAEGKTFDETARLTKLPVEYVRSLFSSSNS